MQIFMSTLETTVLMFIFIIVGYILRKIKLLPENASATLSKLLSYVILPSVVINTFMDKCTIANISARWTYIVTGLVIMLAVTPVAFLVGKLLGHDENENKIFRYSTAISNFGFFGMPLVTAVFGADALFDYLIFTLAFNVYCYSIGIIWLIPGKKFSMKSLLNPTCIALVIGILLGILEVKLPTPVRNAFSNSAACMGPMAMILTGFVVGGYNPVKLLADWRIYAMTAIRLLAIPLVVGLVMTLVTDNQGLIVSALCATAMPLGLNTIVIPAAYGGDTKLGAGFSLVSSILAVVTIPLIFMLFL